MADAREVTQLIPAGSADAQPPNPPEVSRRNVIAAGVIAGITALLGTVKVAMARTTETPISDGVIYPDPNLCIGCLACEVACSDVHRQQGLSAVPRIRILLSDQGKVTAQVSQSSGDKPSFNPMPCKQCPDPECFVVCPTNALLIDPKNKARYIEESVCIACGKCEAACPYEMKGPVTAYAEEFHAKRIFFDPVKQVYTKCDMCRFRPEGPACVSACPVNASIKIGRVKSDHLCLDVKRADETTYKTIA